MSKRRRFLSPSDNGQRNLAVFPSLEGTPILVRNLRRRVLQPAVEEADASWAGFHSFRHTYASLHIERGTNVVQLSRLLGHHSPAFTLTVYAHLIDGNVGEPLDLRLELTSPSRPELLPARAA